MSYLDLIKSSTSRGKELTNLSVISPKYKVILDLAVSGKLSITDIFITKTNHDDGWVGASFKRMNI